MTNNPGNIEIFLNCFKAETTEIVNYIFNRENEPAAQDNFALIFLRSKGFWVDDNIDQLYALLEKIRKNELLLVELCENNKKILEKANFYIGLIEKGNAEFFKVFDQTKLYFDKHLNIDLDSSVFSKILFAKFLKFLYTTQNDYGKIFIASVLIYIYKDPQYFENIYRTALESEELNADQMIFLLFQCYRIYTTKNVKGNDETKVLERLLYRKVYNVFKTQVNINYPYIPAAARNKNVIVVFTKQLLDIEHSPSKVALDKCYTLIENLGKKVILINTGDNYGKGIIPFNYIETPHQHEKNAEYSEIKYKDIAIPFYQPACLMPDAAEIKNILALIYKIKPYLIISLDSFNITADLCDMFSPVLTTSLCFSLLPVTESRFHVIGRKVEEVEFKILEEFGFGQENIIKSLFTFDFTPQKNKYTRARLGLPAKKFLIAVIGLRLDFEITAEFIAALLVAANSDVNLIFIGNFKNFAEFAKKNERFANNAKYLGYQEDVLAVVELCDLYVNPKRDGGGSSAGEAMFKGLPVVTFPHGDVALTAGEDFWVNSYKEMEEKIIRYATDKEFYQEMSAKAKKRGEAVLDTKKELAAMIKTAEARSIF